MESDQDLDAVEWAALRAAEAWQERVDSFLQELMVLVFQHHDGVTDEATVRRHIVGFLGTAESRPGVHRAQRADGWADLQVADGHATVRVDRGGSLMQFDMDPVEAREHLLAANAIDTALGFVAQVFGDILGELTHQRDTFLAGETPQHPAARASNPDAGPSEPAGCGHGGLPAADSVPPYLIRPCPNCGQRMRAYPPSAGGPEWREVPT